MTDIVERLRSWAVFDPGLPPHRLTENAADEIERLRKVQRITEEALANEEEEVSALRAEIADLRKAQGDPLLWIAQGHLREVSNGNTMNCYCAPEQDRFAEVPLYTSAPSKCVVSPTVPEGWQLVPVEPTLLMRSMGYEAYYKEDGAGLIDAYKSMLAAAPKYGE